MNVLSAGQNADALNTPPQLKAAAARAALNLSDDEAIRLVAYGTLLERWNQRINLTASKGLSEILERQVLDCLMADAFPYPAPSNQSVDVVDIGSGAGLPGLIVALRHPDFRVTSLERTSKKVSFQQEAARQLGLSNVTVVQEDAREHASGSGKGRYQVALSRGFADLAGTLPLAAALLRSGGVLRTFKGRKLSEELGAILPGVRRLFDADHIEFSYEVPRTAVAGVLVQFSRL